MEINSKIPSLKSLAEHIVVQNVHLYDSVALPNELVQCCVKLLIQRRKLSDETLSPFLSSELTMLDLTNCHTSLHLQHVVKRCRSLQTLILKGVLSVTDRNLPEVLRMCRKLRRLDLSFNKSISSASLVNSLAFISDTIEEIDISWCTKIGDEVIEKILESCSHLKSLVASNSHNITGSSLQHAHKCKKLQSLEFKG